MHIFVPNGDYCLCVHGHFRNFNIILPSNSNAGLNYFANVMMPFRFMSTLNSNLIDFDLNLI